ncbi:MAG: hypothetical protein ACYTG1_05240 [Planctomycetota bacterium]|jgi:hypothetical protein
MTSGEHESPAGWAVGGDDATTLAAALAHSVGYRGDVTILRRSGGPPIVGYVFDQGTDGGIPSVRLLPADGGGPVAIPCADIARLDFTGRDTAAGRSFETWIRRYVRSKLAGESAGLEPEPLDEPADRSDSGALDP